MQTITYSLKNLSNTGFYKDLELFTDKMLAESNIYFKTEIEKYSQFVINEGIAKIRCAHEYMVEYISLGIFLNKYGTYAQNTSGWAVESMQKLFILRKTLPKLKPVIDNVRGYLAPHLIYMRNSYTVTSTAESFSKLVKWLRATGEFKEEAERLSNWAYYFSTLEPQLSSAIISKASSFAQYFEEQARMFLGIFTRNVQTFLENEHKEYKYREDYLFAGRSETEYHLNMFGAEILNRVLKDDFSKVKNKVLLLPTCMAQPANGQCQAKTNGLQLKCSQCSEKCEVASLTREMSACNVKTFLIPHSSGFSKFLQYWQNQEETGLIGVACVLNLLTGGYEMQRLNIHSQCVFLDYAGCKKHWHKTGLPTSINREQLRLLVNNKQMCLNKNKVDHTLVNNETKVA